MAASRPQTATRRMAMTVFLTRTSGVLRWNYFPPAIDSPAASPPAGADRELETAADRSRAAAVSRASAGRPDAAAEMSRAESGRRPRAAESFDRATADSVGAKFPPPRSSRSSSDTTADGDAQAWHGAEDVDCMPRAECTTRSRRLLPLLTDEHWLSPLREMLYDNALLAKAI